MNRKGFTLLEVLIVVIIIGILAAIALPQYTSTLEKARSAEALSMLGTMRSAMDRHWMEGMAMSSYTDMDLAVGTTGDIGLDIDNPNDNANRKWNYGIADDSTVSTKDYTLGAQRISKETDYWVQIDQDGTLYKSTKLGGAGTKHASGL